MQLERRIPPTHTFIASFSGPRLPGVLTFTATPTFRGSSWSLQGGPACLLGQGTEDKDKVGPWGVQQTQGFTVSRQGLVSEVNEIRNALT